MASRGSSYRGLTFHVAVVDDIEAFHHSSYSVPALGAEGLGHVLVVAEIASEDTELEDIAARVPPLAQEDISEQGDCRHSIAFGLPSGR